MAWGYVIREGISGFSRAKLATFAAVSAMTVALALIGLLFMVGLKAQHVSDWLTQRVGTVDVFLHHVDTDTARTIRDRIASYKGVVQATLVTKEQAARIFKREFGEGTEAFLGQQENFLPASVKVQANPEWVSQGKLPALIRQLRKESYVDDVVYNSQALKTVQENIRTISIFGLMVGGLILIAAVFLVANTIRLTIYARRLLIRTMKLVGATDRFIRKPFLIEGILQGLIGGIIGATTLLIAQTILGTLIPNMWNALWQDAHPVILWLILIALGAILGWLGSLFAVRRFIRHVTLN